LSNKSIIELISFSESLDKNIINSVFSENIFKNFKHFTFISDKFFKLLKILLILLFVLKPSSFNALFNKSFSI